MKFWCGVLCTPFMVAFGASASLRSALRQSLTLVLSLAVLAGRDGPSGGRRRRYSYPPPSRHGHTARARPVRSLRRGAALRSAAPGCLGSALVRLALPGCARLGSAPLRRLPSSGCRPAGLRPAWAGPRRARRVVLAP